MRKITTILIISCITVFGSGCACLKGGFKGFLGISTEEIENARDEAIVKIVNRSKSDCYKMTEARLGQIGSHIYAKEENFIAVYISQTDTTPAGIFFKQIGEGKTQVEISSPASDTKEYLAEKLLPAFK